MITGLKEAHLENASDQDILEDCEVSDPVAGEFLIKFFRLPQPARKLILQGLRASVLCNKCGASSCLCGYSDD